MENESIAASALHNGDFSIPTHRPRMTSHQSNSLPSTPRQRPRDFGAGRRTPSPTHRILGATPRSVSSESNKQLPSLRLNSSACRFMSTQTSRRRIPYTIGTDLLMKEDDKAKATSDPNLENKLSGDMRELYDRLLPSAENQERREKVVAKLYKILSDEWPGKDIEVSMFGSSGNLLCTSKSDVDVCVIMKDLETTCLLADVLARCGMHKVTCVHAKGVPIVKVWDPEFQLACDLNLNNHVALTNTRMVKTYMQLDERVRPLAMIVKHWTSKRVINEASGGTLSSYTWTLLLINFLQTRRPPVLPVLTLRDHKGQPREDLSEDLKLLCGFGEPNKETIGELFFHFFRRYGHEIDYQSAVISVRKGRLLSKEEKGWQLANNNMLCVEEPFNNDRNLGNTADDTAFRGLHLEFRQAFERIADGKDIESSVCEQYEFPVGETRTIFERPQSHARPILTRSHSGSTRGGFVSNGHRGHKHNGGQRNPVNGRRASSATTYNQHTLYQQGPGLLYASPEFLLRSPPQELQAHMQSQHGLQDQLSQLSQQLSREEQRLRAQQQLLFSQAQMQQQAHAMASGQPRGFTATYPGRISGGNSFRNPRASVPDDLPTSAPAASRGFHLGGQLETAALLSQSSSQNGSENYPSSSPLSTSAASSRRGQRAPLPSTASAAVRSRSQPARSIGQQQFGGAHPRSHFASTATSSPQLARHDYPLTNGLHGQQLLGPFVGPYGPYYIPTAAVVEPIPREYLGYGFGVTPQFMQGYPEHVLSSGPLYDDPQQVHPPPSPDPGNESIASSVLDTASRTPSPLDNYELAPELASASQHDSKHYLPVVDTAFSLDNGAHPAPLIVNGSIYGSRTTESHGQHSSRRASDHFHPSVGLMFGTMVEQDEQSPSAMSQSLSALPPPGPSGATRHTLNGTLRSVPQRTSLAVNGGSIHISGDASTTADSNPLLTGRRSTSPTDVNPSSSHDTHTSELRNSGGMRHAVGLLDVTKSGLDATYLPSTVLSPVRETPTPSPTMARKGLDGANGIIDSTIIASPIDSIREEHPPPTPLLVNQLQSNGMGTDIPPTTSGKTHINGTTSAATASPVAHEILSLTKGLTNGINSIPNGNVSGNTWQLATSNRKKKNRASLTVTAAANRAGASLAEVMPANELERKGG